MKKVLLAMSGGVDSSVSAILLQKMGYKVIGATMKLLENNPEIENAKKLCEKLNIEHHVLELQDDFKNCVVNNFVNSYINGQTPNPCVMCNKNIKFGSLYKFAKEINCDYFATGHYAKVEYDEGFGQYVIKKSNALKKDQTYVLYGIDKEIIKDLIFPLGEFENKEQIRKIALESNLEVATKKDSQEICFIPNNDYSNYIEKMYNYKTKPGNVVDKFGKVLGKHKGLINYTIGQRKGIGITSATPLYVININNKKNELIVGEEKDLYSSELYAKDLNFLVPFKDNMEIKAKIRYSAKEASAQIIILEKNIAKIIFEEPQRAITPGQSIVFYINDILIGGGIIETKENLL